MNNAGSRGTRCSGRYTTVPAGHLATDLFPLLVRPAIVGDPHFVDPDAVQFSQLGSNLRLKPELILLECHSLDDLSSEHLVASFHIRQVQASKYVLLSTVRKRFPTACEKYKTRWGCPPRGVGAGPARHSIPDPLVSSAATVAQCPGEFEGAPEVQDQIPRWEGALVQVPRGIRFPTRWCRRPQLSHNAPVNSRVHPKYKTRYRVGNWSAYERALVQRGDVTLWLSPDAVAAWTPRLSGRPGGPRKFSDHAIETALTLRLVFRLPLRQTEGFLRSVLTLMATGLDAPDHTTLSRRGQPLDVALDRVPTHGPVDLVVDSTGLSVFGEGEWAAAKHGGRGKRGWKKLHLGVDRSGVIVAQALTAPTSDDATTGVRFVETVPGDVASVTADTAYDTVAFYAAASARDARVVVPPARTASLSRHGPRSRARDRTIRRVQILGCRRWKKASRYPRQARVENVVFRCKSIIGPGLRARTEAGRQTEALLACDVLNRMTELGRPASYRIGR